MTDFQADTQQAVISGAVAIAVAAIVGLASAVVGVTLPWSVLTFACLALMIAAAGFIAWAGYRTYAFRRTEYTLNRDALIIRHGPERVVIPLSAIRQVTPAPEIGDMPRPARLPLPGWWIGRLRHAALGRLCFYATQPPAYQLVIVTADTSYVVSPIDGPGFVDALQASQSSGASQAVRASRLLPGLLGWPLWRSRTALALLILPLALNLLAFGLGLARFPALPPAVALHYDILGNPDRFGPPAQVLAPPIIALGWVIANIAIGLFAYQREKLAAYLVWGGSAGVQIFFLIATLTIAFAV